ncbi:Forkhead transcription factor [Tilletia horrida]|uniref:Forkhead transcription factor n=1 Tax=Tilletia horrida TaxID=155126 RepID=A0AAN6JQG4_9BASI|nr:Forkhead transcription factor [Tilletia horrida]KAK0546522.1 Forkhead transcription factor [Tilletia horrida]KAK0562311.1 Forkhead transcription factor [Tilletia horrida]
MDSISPASASSSRLPVSEKDETPSKSPRKRPASGPQPLTVITNENQTVPVSPLNDLYARAQAMGLRLSREDLERTRAGVAAIVKRTRSSPTSSSSVAPQVHHITSSPCPPARASTSKDANTTTPTGSLYRRPAIPSSAGGSDLHRPTPRLTLEEVSLRKEQDGEHRRLKRQRRKSEGTPQQPQPSGYHDPPVPGSSSSYQQHTHDLASSPLSHFELGFGSGLMWRYMDRSGRPQIRTRVRPRMTLDEVGIREEEESMQKRKTRTRRRTNGGSGTESNEMQEPFISASQEANPSHYYHSEDNAAHARLPSNELPIGRLHYSILQSPGIHRLGGGQRSYLDSQNSDMEPRRIDSSTERPLRPIRYGGEVALLSPHSSIQKSARPVRFLDEQEALPLPSIHGRTAPKPPVARDDEINALLQSPPVAPGAGGAPNEVDEEEEEQEGTFLDPPIVPSQARDSSLPRQAEGVTWYTLTGSPNAAPRSMTDLIPAQRQFPEPTTTEPEACSPPPGLDDDPFTQSSSALSISKPRTSTPSPKIEKDHSSASQKRLRSPMPDVPPSSQAAPSSVRGKDAEDEDAEPSQAPPKKKRRKAKAADQSKSLSQSNTSMEDTSVSQLLGHELQEAWDYADGTRVIKLVSDELAYALRAGTIVKDEIEPRYVTLPVHWGQDKSKPSNASYAGLIGLAILSSSDGKLGLAEIYQWINLTFPFYEMRDRGWQNSIRHNLSLNKSFIKVERNKAEKGKGALWSIVPGHECRFENGSYNAKKATMPNSRGGNATEEEAAGGGDEDGDVGDVSFDSIGSTRPPDSSQPSSSFGSTKKPSTAELIALMKKHGGSTVLCHTLQYGTSHKYYRKPRNPAEDVRHGLAVPIQLPGTASAGDESMSSETYNGRVVGGAPGLDREAHGTRTGRVLPADASVLTTDSLMDVSMDTSGDVSSLPNTTAAHDSSSSSSLSIDSLNTTYETAPSLPVAPILGSSSRSLVSTGLAPSAMTIGTALGPPGGVAIGLGQGIGMSPGLGMGIGSGLGMGMGMGFAPIGMGMHMGIGPGISNGMGIGMGVGLRNFGVGTNTGLGNVMSPVSGLSSVLQTPARNSILGPTPGSISRDPAQGPSLISGGSGRRNRRETRTAEGASQWLFSSTPARRLTSLGIALSPIGGSGLTHGVLQTPARGSLLGSATGSVTDDHVHSSSIISGGSGRRGARDGRKEDGSRWLSTFTPVLRMMNGTGPEYSPTGSSAAAGPNGSPYARSSRTTIRGRIGENGGAGPDSILGAHYHSKNVIETTSTPSAAVGRSAALPGATADSATWLGDPFGYQGNFSHELAFTTDMGGFGTGIDSSPAKEWR